MSQSVFEQAMQQKPVKRVQKTAGRNGLPLSLPRAAPFGLHKGVGYSVLPSTRRCVLVVPEKIQELRRKDGLIQRINQELKKSGKD